MKDSKNVNNFDEFLNECWSPEMGDPGAAGYPSPAPDMETQPGQQFDQPQGDLPPPTMPGTMLAIQTTLRLAHWQTISFAQHEAFGKIYAEIDALADSLVEVYIGKYGNRNVLEGSSIGLMNTSMEEMHMIADVCLAMLNMAAAQLLNAEDTEILNIVDEIKALLQKLKYLFTLKENEEK